jgi:hypothetical protein
VIVRLGGQVSAGMRGGQVRACPGSLLYDDSGQDWPRCSLLVLPGVERLGREPGKVTRFARQWFGEEYAPLEGRVSLPDKDLKSWRSVGEVERLFFTRAGDVPEEHGLNSKMVHPFAKVLPFGGELPVLYASGGATRIELGAGCVLNWRGIVKP